MATTMKRRRILCRMTNEPEGDLCGAVIIIYTDKKAKVSDVPWSCPNGHGFNVDEREAIVEFLNKKDR